MSLWNPTPEEIEEGKKALKDVKLKDMTKQEIRDMIRNNRKEYERKRNECPYTPRAGVCVVCEGKVTEKYSKEFDPSTGPMIIGPGSRSQFKWQSSGLSCQECGISYAKLPKQKDSAELKSEGDDM